MGPVEPARRDGEDIYVCCQQRSDDTTTKGVVRPNRVMN